MVKKVLHLITHLGIGGAQDNTLLTVEKCDRTRFDVHIASYPDGKWSDRAKKATEYFHAIPNLVHPIHPLKDVLCLFDLVKLFRLSSHGQRLIRLNLIDDLEYCAKENIMSVLPTQNSEGAITIAD